MQLVLSEEEVHAIATELKKQLAPMMIAEIRKLNTLPAIMTRKQFMEIANIGERKCAELFNRHDFPVCREFGHPRIHSERLIEWMDANTPWVAENAPHLRDIRAV